MIGVYLFPCSKVNTLVLRAFPLSFRLNRYLSTNADRLRGNDKEGSPKKEIAGSRSVARPPNMGRNPACKSPSPQTKLCRVIEWRPNATGAGFQKLRIDDEFKEIAAQP